MTHSARRTATFLALAAPVALLSLAPGCNKGDEPYQPKPAYSGAKPKLPPVPTLPQKAIKEGDAYTVWGAIHHLRSRVHNQEVEGKELTLTGYIVKTNLPDAPPCAVHKTGVADKDDCKPPLPSFWIADEMGEEKNVIQVLGWASNFANVHDAILHYEKKNVSEAYRDGFWDVEIPNPIPNVGAKVKVTGTYGVAFTKATSGVESDPLNGVLSFSRLSYVEPPEEGGRLPGMRKR